MPTLEVVPSSLSGAHKTQNDKTTGYYSTNSHVSGQERRMLSSVHVCLSVPVSGSRRTKEPPTRNSPSSALLDTCMTAGERASSVLHLHRLCGWRQRHTQAGAISNGESTSHCREPEPPHTSERYPTPYVHHTSDTAQPPAGRPAVATFILSPISSSSRNTAGTPASIAPLQPRSHSPRRALAALLHRTGAVLYREEANHCVYRTPAKVRCKGAVYGQ